MTIADLMSKAREGDNEAYGELYQNYLTPIFRYIFFRVKDRETAEDLTQTVFLRVLERQGNFSTDNLAKAYFFRTARNLVIDHWRKKKEVLIGEDELTLPDVSRITLQEDVDQKMVLDIARNLIDKLDEKSREIIILKFVNELSNREVAEFLNKSESAVRQAQCRALKKLRRLIGTATK